MEKILNRHFYDRIDKWKFMFVLINVMVCFNHTKIDWLSQILTEINEQCSVYHTGQLTRFKSI